MSMIICEDDHVPVVYEEFDRHDNKIKCPVCEALARCHELEKYNSELEDSVDNLQMVSGEGD